jgi:tRNA(Ser,Leu) C12 N-acetylase TAN1
MKTCNLLVTMAEKAHFGYLLRELSRYGEFQKTEFFGVILGQVPNLNDFLEDIRKRGAEEDPFFQEISRMVPFDSFFVFRLDNFLDKSREAISPYLKQLAGKRFYVRLERRGLKGKIVSPEVEKSLDTFIMEKLGERGTSATVDFADPDAIVALETVGDRCGVSLLSRDMMDRYEFVKVP